MAITLNLQFCLGWSLMRASVTFLPSPLVTSIVTASLNWFSARLGSQPSQGTSEPAKLTLSQSRILSPQNVLVRKNGHKFNFLPPFTDALFNYQRASATTILHAEIGCTVFYILVSYTIESFLAMPRKNRGNKGRMWAGWQLSLIWKILDCIGHYCNQRSPCLMLV